MSEEDEKLIANVATKLRHESMWEAMDYFSVATAIVFAIRENERLKQGEVNQ